MLPDKAPRTAVTALRDTRRLTQAEADVLPAAARTKPVQELLRLRSDPSWHTHAVSTVPQGSPVSPGLGPVQLPRSKPRHGGVVRGTRRNRVGVRGRSGLPRELFL